MAQINKQKSHTLKKNDKLLKLFYEFETLNQLTPTPQKTQTADYYLASQIFTLKLRIY